MKKPELLVPAGDIETFYEAINAGADAVYLAGKSFGARAFANNFTTDELKEIIDYAHLYGRKVYVTVNTIVFDDEFLQLKEFLDFLYLNRCDAIIVQDLGVANFILHNYPLFDLHASTQMNIKTVSEAKVLKELGFKRIILARETSIEEIKKIKQEVDIELEVFVHGALCVCMSGNCFLSSFSFKRSGNRGKCAGNCRLPYTLDENEKGYLLSSKDLCTIEYLKELMESEIDSFKIEGRMKRKEYVTVITKAYKNKIESILKGKKFNLEANIKSMKLMFNREFTKGFMFNCNKGDFSNTSSPNHIGVRIGQVISSSKNKVTILLEDDLEYLDSIRLKTKTKEDAITINEMFLSSSKVKKASKGDVITIQSHEENMDKAICYKTTSASLMNIASEALKIKINGRCYIHNKCLALNVYYQDKVVNLALKEEIQKASNENYSQRIKEQLLKTGSTPFVFESLVMGIPTDTYVSIKEINNLRRKALEKLEMKIKNVYEDRKPMRIPFEKPSKKQDDFQIKIRINEEKQLIKVLEIISDYSFNFEIYFNDLALYNKYYQKLQEKNISSRYFLPREDGNKYDIPVVSSSLASVAFNVASVYTNVCNTLSCNLLDKMKVKTISLSIEMTKEDIKNMIKKYQTEFTENNNFEMMVYGYYEVMYTSYCLLNKMGLCGKCHGVHFLKDRKGFVFPFMTTSTCHMKIYNSKRVHLINYLDELKNIGINSFLIDFSIEKEEEVEEVLVMYLEKLNGKDTQTFLEGESFGHFKEGVR